MKRHSIFKIALAHLLGLAVLFTVSVQEVHYLFVQHHLPTEVCNNHLHSADAHGSCAVCKFDVSLFTDEITPLEFTTLTGTLNCLVARYTPVIITTTFTAYHHRGPPVTAT